MSALCKPYKLDVKMQKKEWLYYKINVSIYMYDFSINYEDIYNVKN